MADPTSNKSSSLGDMRAELDAASKELFGTGPADVPARIESQLTTVEQQVNNGPDSPSTPGPNRP